MTRKCHSRCFMLEQLQINKDCLNSCYHKYINTISKLEKLTHKIGVEKRSDFMVKAYFFNYDWLDYYIFPYTGTREYTYSVRPLQFYDNYRSYFITGINPYKDDIELR